MPKAKRRKNIFGFGRKSSGNYIPASGGIAKHAPKHRAKASSASSSSDNYLDEIAHSLTGKSYKSLPASKQQTVRDFAARAKVKNRKRNAGAGSRRKTKKAMKKSPFFQGYTGTIMPRGAKTTKRKRNLEVGLPSNQFVNAKVRMKGGKIQVMADERILGKAGFKAGVGLKGVSVSGGAKLNPKKRGKRNPAKTQFVVEWGGGTNFFNTLKSAKRYIGGLRSRGLAYGRYIKIVKMEPGKPSKTVFEKEY